MKVLPYCDFLSTPSSEMIRKMVADGARLADLLTMIVLSVESTLPGATCSILLLDQTGQHLQLGAAPNLPKIYNDSLQGLQIGPGIGCCGQAAYTRKRVAIEDVLTHPNWAPFVDLVKLANFRSSVSEPILTQDGNRVLGTVAIYHSERLLPPPNELELMERAAIYAAAIIEEIERIGQ